MDIQLRKWNEHDIDSLVSNANSQNLTTYLRNSFPFPYTRDCAKSFIDFCTQTSSSHNYAITINDIAIGNISLDFCTDIKSHSAELGYWIGEDYWNKGYVTLALQKLIQLYASDKTLKRIFAEVVTLNVGSIRVLEKMDSLMKELSKKVFTRIIFYMIVIYTLSY